MILDRQYQTEAVTSIWTYFATRSGNPVVAMPTGTGKSVVIARFLQSVFYAYPNQKVLMLTHVKELIKQNYQKLIDLWNFAPVGIYSAGLNERDHTKAITFAGIASVAKQWAIFGKVDLIIIDEAHLLSPNDTTMYKTFIAGLKSINPMLKVIGFTATPWRLGHGSLIDPVIKANGAEIPSLFTDFCFDITGIEPFNRLLNEGYLVPLIPKDTKTELSVDGVHMRGGEFIENELQFAVDKDEITDAALREAIELGANRKKWLVFAAGTEHADNVALALNMFGISAVSIHSKREGRDEGIADFRAGRVRAVVNNNMLTTGFDDPEIDLIVCLRPTASAVLWVQMLGRGTRPLWNFVNINGVWQMDPRFDLNTIEGRLGSIEASGKHNCLVLDFAGNTERLGPINDPVVPKKKGEKGGKAPVKKCPVCNTWIHASAKFCNTRQENGTICTHEFKFETKLEHTASSKELIKTENPIVEVLAVDHITVSLLEKQSVPNMMRVSYWCGLRSFSEVLCFEHTNYAGKLARDWWRARSSKEPPTTTADALEKSVSLAPATHIRIWLNRKPYPQILAACFDGTAFGTQTASDSYAKPVIELNQPRKSVAPSFGLDDDIPF